MCIIKNGNKSQTTYVALVQQEKGDLKMPTNNNRARLSDKTERKMTLEMVEAGVLDAIREVIQNDREYSYLISKPLQNLNPKIHLVEDLSFDSLDFVSLNLALEERFSCDLNMEANIQKNKLNTLQDLSSFVYCTIQGIEPPQKVTSFNLCARIKQALSFKNFENAD